MKIRLADEGDTQFLIQEYLRFVGRDMDAARRYALLNLQVDRTLVVQEESLLVGILHWGQREVLSEGLAQITGTRILASRFNQGVGNQLLQAAIEDMTSYFAERGSKLRRVFMMTSEAELYGAMLKSFGFKRAARLADHYADGRVGIVYVWEPK